MDKNCLARPRAGDMPKSDLKFKLSSFLVCVLKLLIPNPNHPEEDDDAPDISYFDEEDE